jgi:hypothetical protein
VCHTAARLGPNGEAAFGERNGWIRHSQYSYYSKADNAEGTPRNLRGRFLELAGADVVPDGQATDA